MIVLCRYLRWPEISIPGVTRQRTLSTLSSSDALLSSSVQPLDPEVMPQWDDAQIIELITSRAEIPGEENIPTTSSSDGFRFANKRLSHAAQHFSINEQDTMVLSHRESPVSASRSPSSLHPAESSRICICPECKKPFTSQPNLQRHMRSIHEKKELWLNQFPCTLCTEVLGRIDAWKNHVERCRGKRSGGSSTPYTVGNELSASRPSLGKGRGPRKSSQPFVCPCCDVEYTWKSIEGHIPGCYGRHQTGERKAKRQKKKL